MRHLTKWKFAITECGYGEIGIVLIDASEQILSVAKVENGFKFTEECNGCFSETYSKEDALKVIDELREWITNH